MATTPRDHQSLDRHPRERSLSPQRPIRHYTLREAVLLKNEIKTQLQPAIKQWLATQSSLTSTERQQIGRAIRTAYRQGITTLPDVEIALPESIRHLLVQQAARLDSPRRVLEQQLGSWIGEADQDKIQQTIRQMAANKIKVAYDNQATHLDLQGMQLTSLPSVWGAFTSLQSLSLSNNQLCTLPDSLKQLTSLISIDCSGNAFSELPPVLEQLPSLNSVLFRDQPPPASRQNREIHRRHGHASHVKAAWEAKQFNESLEAWVQRGTEKAGRKRAEAARRIQSAYEQRLDRLDLAGWELTELPETLVHLHALQELNLSYNNLQQLPTWFNQLKSLKKVQLAGNYFTELPEVLKAMPVTVDLAHSGESMTELAERMAFEGLIRAWRDQEGATGIARKSGAADRLLTAYLRKSTHLDLSNQQLPNLPENIFSKLSQLESVVLFNNRLQALPNDFAALTLKQLDLAGNEFSNFPTSLHTMGTLEKLSLYGNQLTEISAEAVADLQQVKYLDLGNNKLHKLFTSQSTTPPSKALLPKLESLNLNHNELTQLPELKRWSNLKDLGGVGNYLDPVPDTLRQLRNPWFQPRWDNPQAPWSQRQLPKSVQLREPTLNRLTESMSGGGYGAGSSQTEPAFIARAVQTPLTGARSTTRTIG